MFRITAALASATLVVAGVALTASTSPAAAAAADQSCTSIPIFETDGYHAAPTAATYQDYNRRVPAGYTARPVYYDGGIFPFVDARALDNAIADGTARLTAAVREFHAACPSTRIIITGYSEGALVAGDTLANFSKTDEIPHDLLRGVLYSDARREVGDGGRAGRAGGIETSIPSFLPGVTMQGPRGFGDLLVHSICNENDGICNSANFFTNAPAFLNGLVGYATGAHVYDKDPVRDQGNGQTLVRQNPVVPYGPSLPLAIDNPYQLQQRLGITPTLFTTTIEQALSKLPGGNQILAQPWVRIALGKY